MALNYLLYASYLNVPMGYEELKDLLDVSQRNNARADITGFLHIEDQIVLQYLEGPPAHVQNTYKRIQRDARHTRVKILSEAHIDRRFFDGWQMALVENTTFSLADLQEEPSQQELDVSRINPADLITLLSANASYLRAQPSVLAS